MGEVDLEVEILMAGVEGTEQYVGFHLMEKRRAVDGVVEEEDPDNDKEDMTGEDADTLYSTGRLFHFLQQCSIYQHAT